MDYDNDKQEASEKGRSVGFEGCPCKLYKKTLILFLIPCIHIKSNALIRFLVPENKTSMSKQ